MKNKITIGIIAVFITLFSSCKNSSKIEDLETDKHAIYTEAVDRKVSKLDVERKQQRAKWLDELSKNPVYIDLTQKSIVSEEYLPTLNAISDAIKNTYLIDGVSQFGISENVAQTIEKSNNGEQKMNFIIIVSSLSIDSNGGIPKEIVNIFDRYKGKYNLYGDAETVLYDSAGKKIQIKDNYNLSYVFLLFNPEDTVALDAIYDATKKGISQWSEDFDQVYVNGFMAIKSEYMRHLKKVYPQSPNISNVDFEITSSELYNTYEVNEVSADEKYKGKKIVITGIIDNIGKDVMNNPYISFREDYLKSVTCYFSKEDNKIISKVRKGEKISIIGECRGMTLTNVIIKDCGISK